MCEFESLNIFSLSSKTKKNEKQKTYAVVETQSNKYVWSMAGIENCLDQTVVIHRVKVHLLNSYVFKSFCLKGCNVFLTFTWIY